MAKKRREGRKKQKLFEVRSRRGFKRLPFKVSKYDMLSTQGEIDEYNRFFTPNPRKQEIESIGRKRYKDKYAHNALSKK